MTNEEFFDIGRVAYTTGNLQEALDAKQALEKVVESANSTQQLKAEIAALAVELDDGTSFEGEHVDVINRVIRKLRQLSAV